MITLDTATTRAAYAQGYEEGETGRTLSAWPLPADLAKRDAITLAWCRGWKHGYETRHTGVPGWVYDDEMVRSDAAPGL